MTETVRMSPNGPPPTVQHELHMLNRGLSPVVGIDEAGRGALAGPVVAGAVVADWGGDISWCRDELYDIIMAHALSAAAGIVGHDVIDRVGIVGATKRAMYAAVRGLTVTPRAALIDWVVLPSLRMPQKSLAQGDALCFSIACASIVAKVTRDRLMIEMDSEYPEYGFRRNKGYATEYHMERLIEVGACPIHRATFEPVSLVLGGLL
jgi:ribonuclease HII